MFELGACNLNKFVITTTSEKPIYQHPYRKSGKEREAIKQVNRKNVEGENHPTVK